MKNKIKISLKLIKSFKNIFFVVTLIFIIWMLFFDANSWLVQRELNKEIDLRSPDQFYIDKKRRTYVSVRYRKQNYTLW